MASAEISKLGSLATCVCARTCVRDLLESSLFWWNILPAQTTHLRIINQADTYSDSLPEGLFKNNNNKVEKWAILAAQNRGMIRYLPNRVSKNNYILILS